MSVQLTHGELLELLKVDAAELEARTAATTEALPVWFDAMVEGRTVWARAFNGAGEPVEDWFEATVVENRRPSPYNVVHGTVCVRRTTGHDGCTYIYPPSSDSLSLEPRSPDGGSGTGA